MSDQMFEELAHLINSGLLLDCPVMSGNMKSNIAMEEMGASFARIEISGPSYDIPEWRATGAIHHTGEYDYAVSVNGVGAFEGKSKKSRHWANKSVVKSCRAIATLYGAEVQVDVEL